MKTRNAENATPASENPKRADMLGGKILYTFYYEKYTLKKKLYEIP